MNGLKRIGTCAWSAATRTPIQVPALIAICVISAEPVKLLTTVVKSFSVNPLCKKIVFKLALNFSILILAGYGATSGWEWKLDAQCVSEHFVCKPGFRRFSDGSLRCYSTGTCIQGTLQVCFVSQSQGGPKMISWICCWHACIARHAINRIISPSFSVRPLGKGTGEKFCLRGSQEMRYGKSKNICPFLTGWVPRIVDIERYIVHLKREFSMRSVPLLQNICNSRYLNGTVEPSWAQRLLGFELNRVLTFVYGRCFCSDKPSEEHVWSRSLLWWKQCQTGRHMPSVCAVLSKMKMSRAVPMITKMKRLPNLLSAMLGILFR